jgi:RNA polymerase primary sigma factor
MAKQESYSSSTSRSVSSNFRFALERYLNDISCIPLLSAQEEIELTKRIRQNDQVALKKLVRANLRFVVKIAKEYQNQGLPLTDLINEGNLGLIRAAKRFDETRGFKFISYAVWWIRQSILKGLAEHSRVVRLPLNRLNAISKVKQTIRGFEQKHNRAPTFQEMANELELSILDISHALTNSGYHISLDQPINRSESGAQNTLKEFLKNTDEIAPDGQLIMDSLKEEIQRVLKTLSPREEKIIKLYFGIDNERPYTLEEIGERFELTRERVRQIKEKALSRLRHQSRCQTLRPFL